MISPWTLADCVSANPVPPVDTMVLKASSTPLAYDLADWVLGVFPYDQRETMEETYRRAAQAAKALILQGPEAAANQFNRKFNHI